MSALKDEVLGNRQTPTQFQNATLSGINRMLEQALDCKDERQLGQICLDVALELTQSRFGFIGGIKADGYITDIAVGGSRWVDYPHRKSGVHPSFRGGLQLQGIFKRAIEEKQPVFTNDFDPHEHGIRVPPQHPPLKSFLVTPLIQNDCPVGLVGLAGKDGGYGPEDTDTMKAMAQAMVQVLMHYRAREELRTNETRLETAVAERTRELRQSKQQIDDILESISDAFYAIDSEWRVTYANPQAVEWCRYRREEAIGKVIWDLFPNWKKTGSYQEHRRAMEERIPVQYELFSPPLNIWVEGTVYPTANGGLSVYFRDVTKRKQAEEELRQSEERFHGVFHNSPEPIIVNRERDNHYVEVNPRFTEVLGYTREEVIGHTPEELGIVGDLETLESLRAELHAAGPLRYEMNFLTKSGEIVNTLCSAKVVDFGGERCRLTVVKDMTNEKRFEAEMAKLDRLDLVGEMAASLGHEIRNPMTTIRGFLQMLDQKEEIRQYREYFRLMIDELDRANSIITDYLDMAKDKTIDIKPRYLNSIVRALYPMLKADAAYTDKEVKLELGMPPQLLMDEKEMRQLIMNLARNGIEAMEPGGVLTIRTGDAEGVGWVELADQGKGIPPEILEKLGTPFVTTKEDGTGLGLAVCYSIAHRHKARIEVETGAQGTTFRVYFPITAA